MQLLDTRWGAAQFKKHLCVLLDPASSAQTAAGEATGDPGGVAIGPGGILQQAASGGGRPAASQALLGFSCTTVSNDEPWVLKDMAGGGDGVLELQGGKFQAELGPGPGTNQPALHSFTTTLGLLRGA
jgi:hypothetical protein